VEVEMTGYELKMRRLAVRLDQYKVAAKLGVTAQFISAIELGRKRVPIGFAERYLAVVDDYERRLKVAGLLPETALGSQSERSE
jgi:transcriptional regulator with XRE-family HTH domain